MQPQVWVAPQVPRRLLRRRAWRRWWVQQSGGLLLLTALVLSHVPTLRSCCRRHLGARPQAPRGGPCRSQGEQRVWYSGCAQGPFLTPLLQLRRSMPACAPFRQWFSSPQVSSGGWLLPAFLRSAERGGATQLTAHLAAERGALWGLKLPGFTTQTKGDYGVWMRFLG